MSERQRLLRLIVTLGVLEGVLAVGQYLGVAHTYYAGSATVGSGYRATGTLGNWTTSLSNSSSAVRWAFSASA